MSITDQFNRNQLIKGWGAENQKLIQNQHIVVHSEGFLGQYIVASLIGMGIGKITVFGSERVDKNAVPLFTTKQKDIGSEVVKNMDTYFSPYGNIHGHFGIFCPAFIHNDKPNCIIDTSNTKNLTSYIGQYALSHKIPFINCGANEKKGFFTVSHNSLENMIQKTVSGKNQSAHISGVIAGLVAENIRQMTFTYQHIPDPTTKNNLPIWYNCCNKTRNSIKDHLDLPPRYLRNKKVLIVGAGGIGNFFAVYLAKAGVMNIDVIDDDIVELHNCNRQMHHLNSIGNKKAENITNRMSLISPHGTYSPICARIGDGSVTDPWVVKSYTYDTKIDPSISNIDLYVKEHFTPRSQKNYPLVNHNWVSKQNYDLLVGCLDNKYARITLNNWATSLKIPYIDGGTGPFSGEINTYIPGKNPCIECTQKLSQYPFKNSCRDGPDASVVMSNLIIAGMMVSESLRILGNQPNVLYQSIHYNVQNPIRIGIDEYTQQREGEHLC